MSRTLLSNSVQALLWKPIWKFLKKLEPPCDIAIPFLVYLKELKSRSQKDTCCTPMFHAALFIIAKIWKQPKCPLTDEWINKMQYIHTVGYYSAKTFILWPLPISISCLLIPETTILLSASLSLAVLESTYIQWDHANVFVSVSG